MKMSKSRIPYFDFYPADFMHGARGLSAHEVGVYTMMLCRIYEENGPVEFSALRLSTYCGMRESTFKNTIEKLVALGKLDLADGCISNRRALDEIASRSHRLKLNSKAGKASAEKRQLNQQGKSTPVQPTINHTDTDTIVKEIPKGISKKATRIGDFIPDVSVGVGLGLSLSQANRECDKFLDFWRGKSGQNGTKLDWPATWRNWCRTAAERLPVAHGPPLRTRSMSDFTRDILDGMNNAGSTIEGRVSGGNIPTASLAVPAIADESH